MNVLRSLARELLNLRLEGGPARAASPLEAVRQRPVPQVAGLDRFRDAFEGLPQGARGALKALSAERAAWRPTAGAALRGDGFSAARSAPVDLSGGVRPAILPAEAAPEPTPAPTAEPFLASLDDLPVL